MNNICVIFGGQGCPPYEAVIVVSFLFDRFILFAFKFEALFVMVFELELNLVPFVDLLICVILREFKFDCIWQ